MPPKKTEGNLALRQLKQDLSNHALGKLYVFHGEEAYLRDYYLEEMKKELVGEWEAFSFHRFSGKGLNIPILSDAVDALPLGSARTMVLVYDYDLYQSAEKDALQALLSDLPDYCCLIFVYDILPYKQDARTKLHTVLKKQCRVVQFAQQGQGELIRWIRRRFKALGRDIGERDAEYLLFLCGGLMTGLISEIEKIGAYAKEPAIRKEDIDAVADPVLDAVVFQMTDAMLHGEMEKAAAVLGDLLRMQHSPIMLLAVLGKQMRQLYTARLAIDRGKDAAYLMELWGMRSSYPAQKLMRGARKFDTAWCRQAVQLCAEADLEMKRSGTPGETLMVGLLMRLINGVQ